MIQRLFLGTVSALALFGAANAQTVPVDFGAINVSNVSGGQMPPEFVGLARIGVSWPTANSSAGVYSWGVLDTALTAILAKNARTLVLTGTAVPSWVNSTPLNCLDTPTRQQNYNTFIAALMSHEGPGKINVIEPWNEFQYQSSSGYWACPDTVTGDAYLAATMALVYPTIKAADPNTIVTAPSFTSGGDPTGNPYPVSPYYHLDNFFAATAGFTTRPFDELNLHSYTNGVGGPGDSSVNVTYAPELALNQLNAYKGVAAQYGYGSLPMEDTEGFPAPTSGWTDSATMAGLFARMQMLVSSWGAAHWQPFIYVNNTPATNNLGSSAYASGLNLSGQALKNVGAWIGGSTWTTPLARVAGTNLLGSIIAGSPATGKIAGTGANCPGTVPGGTATLSTGYSFALAHSAAGLSAYLTGFGTDAQGHQYLEIEVCGQDTTAGTGASSAQLRGSSIAATQNQWVSFGEWWGKTGGTYTGLQYWQDETDEYTSGNAYINYHNDVYSWPAAPPLQHNEWSFQMLQATAAKVFPYWSATFYYNSSAPITVDMKYRIADPDLEINSTQWSGVLTDSGGTTRCIMWDASNGSSTGTPPSACSTFGYYRDVYNIEHTMTPGSAPLTGSPILIEAAPWKTGFPSL